MCTVIKRVRVVRPKSEEFLENYGGLIMNGTFISWKMLNQLAAAC